MVVTRFVLVRSNTMLSSRHLIYFLIPVQVSITSRLSCSELSPYHGVEGCDEDVKWRIRKERKREMLLDKGSIDLVLVPCGLAIMLGYHLMLLYRVLRYPHKTVIGYENHNKRAWVERMMHMSPEETGLAMSVIASNISASSNLASLSIALSSLIGAWAGSSSSIFTTSIIYGNNSRTIASVKYIALLICFLVAFTCFIQSTRYYVHSSFLMSTLDSDIPVSYVQTAIIRGGNFWSMGLRALYFATTLLLWIFGPIPMFTCSLFMVIILHVLDSNYTPLHNYKYRSAKNVNHNRNKGAAALPNSNPINSSINYSS